MARSAFTSPLDPGKRLLPWLVAVAIPGLIGPMLGPRAGKLIVEHFHWSVIFFVNAPQMIHGIHQAFLILGGLTILSTIVFAGLR